MGTTETYKTTDTKLTRIAWLSKQDSTKEFGCLMHLFNQESLLECFKMLDGRKALGVDGVSKTEYAEHLDKNIEDLLGRMKRMAYVPGPVRQVQIPKAGKPGATRPLGISNFEDKLVQTMTQRILQSIYEPLFLDCSYGFRPGKSCHDAVKALHQHLYRKPVATVIDIDLENFFGTIDHRLLERILREKITDERFMRYIIRMFKSGVLAKGELTVSAEGVPQGNIASPVLANLFAHHVLDQWFEDTVKKHCRGEVKLFRYCDDAVICCQYSHDAEKIERVLGKRLAKFNLKLNQDKTKLVSFTRHAEKGASFEFLGFIFYWGNSRKGAKIPKLKTSGKRMRAKLKNANLWAKSMKDKIPIGVFWKMLCIKLEGHIRYFGVSHNLQRVETFLHHVKRVVFK